MYEWIMCACVEVHVSHGTYVEVTGQLCGVGIKLRSAGWHDKCLYMLSHLEGGELGIRKSLSRDQVGLCAGSCLCRCSWEGAQQCWENLKLAQVTEGTDPMTPAVSLGQECVLKEEQGCFCRKRLHTHGSRVRGKRTVYSALCLQTPTVLLN